MTRGQGPECARRLYAPSVLEAFALVYMGVHYLTDVAGALAISAAWLGVIRWILPPATLNTKPPS